MCCLQLAGLLFKLCSARQGQVKKVVHQTFNSDGVLYMCIQANVEISIPREHHKFILGKGGKTLQQLELQTATKITMPRDGSDLIRIVGTKEGVDSARHEIQIISDEQVSWFANFLYGGKACFFGGKDAFC